MRKKKLLIILFFAGLVSLAGCKKNMVDEQYNPIINPVTPDFITKISAGINGFITDENGEAVEDAIVTAGIVTATTDEFGYFKISNAAFAKSAGFVQVNKAGYFAGFRTFLPVAGKETFIRLQLIPKTNTGTVDAAAGGTISTTNGATITLPASGVVLASNSSAYTGTVNIATHWLDPSDMQKTSLTMPGDLTGVDSAGHLNVLQTFGMLAVELTGNSGELLQIAPGKKALLHFPLPSSLQSIAPSYIPLWHFDETKGVWVQEGHAVKNGNSYDGEVSHFSYWNCDVGLPLVNFTAQVVDTALNPLANVPVSVTVTNLSNTARTAFTDTNGIVNGLIPANSVLTIDIIAPCNQSANANTITTANEAVDLGVIILNPNLNTALLEGTVTKCNGEPVTDGFVIVTGFGSNAIININNGVFFRAGVICPGTNASIIAFDRETSQQSDVQTITINTGANNTGVLEACSTNTTEIITVYREGLGTTVYALPQHLFGGNFYFANDSTSINAIDLLNGNQEVFQMSYTGSATVGTYAVGNGAIVRINNSSWYFDPGTNVIITSYGQIGQFITGTISGMAFSEPPLNLRRLVNIDFSVQRDQ